MGHTEYICDSHVSEVSGLRFSREIQNMELSVGTKPRS